MMFLKIFNMSPLFFFHTNDFPKASSIRKTIIYADDGTLYTNLSDFKHHNNHRNDDCDKSSENYSPQL